MILTPRQTVTTSIYGRDPVGRKYLSTEDGKIITTESGEWIIAIDTANTVLTGRATYQGQTWDDLGIMTWNDLGIMTWNDLFTGPIPTTLTGRNIPN